MPINLTQKYSQEDPGWNDIIQYDKTEFENKLLQPWLKNAKNMTDEEINFYTPTLQNLNLIEQFFTLAEFKNKIYQLFHETNNDMQSDKADPNFTVYDYGAKSYEPRIFCKNMYQILNDITNKLPSRVLTTDYRKILDHFNNYIPNTLIKKRPPHGHNAYDVNIHDFNLALHHFANTDFALFKKDFNTLREAKREIIPYIKEYQNYDTGKMGYFIYRILEMLTQIQINIVKNYQKQQLTPMPKALIQALQQKKFISKIEANQIKHL